MFVLNNTTFDEAFRSDRQNLKKKNIWELA